MSFSFTKFTWWLLVTATVVLFAAAGPYVMWYYLSGVVLVLALLLGIHVKNHTLWGWLRIRRRSTSPKLIPEQAVRYGLDQSGLVWDGQRVTVMVEVAQRPFTITQVASNGRVVAPELPVDAIRRNCLVQYDIHTDDVDLITTGYRFALSDRASSVLASVVGPLPLPLYARTVAAVSVSLDGSLDSAYARMDRGRSPDGLARTAQIAAQRLQRELERNGFVSRVLGSGTIQGMHNEVLRQVGSPLIHPSWGQCGKRHSVNTVSYALLPGHWKDEDYTDACTLPYHRQYISVKLSRNRHHREHLGAPNTDRAEVLMTYVTSDPSALSGAPSYGLRRLSGQQRNALTRFLPAARTNEVLSPGKDLAENDDLGFAIHPGGLGVYVGPSKDRERIFVSITPSETPLHIIGPVLLAQQFVLRLSCQALRINVAVDAPEWERFVADRDSELVSWKSDTAYDVIVMTPIQYETNKPVGKVVLLVSDELPAVRPECWITVKGTTGVVESRRQQVRFKWEVTSSESAWLRPGPASVGTSSTVS